ncbi:MAG TPA: hypothetical protein VFC00_08230 [Micromonosporaceae bacterium]|nr:hypothetical protein [Micromonosporaceae bacterium]
MPPDIDAIRRRVRLFAEAATDTQPAVAVLVAKDVPVLLVEIDRLSAENESLRAENALLGQAVDRLLIQQRQQGRAS